MEEEPTVQLVFVNAEPHGERRMFVIAALLLGLAFTAGWAFDHYLTKPHEVACDTSSWQDENDPELPAGIVWEEAMGRC